MSILLASACATNRIEPDPVTPRTASPTLLCWDQFHSWARSTSEAGQPRLTSPWIETARSWNELVVSWNVEPANNAGLEVEAELGAAGTLSEARLYHMGQWSFDGHQPLVRTSLRNQRDVVAEVKTDTLVLRQPARRVRLHLTLHGALATNSESLRRVALAFNDRDASEPDRPANEHAWGRTLEVPERSQVIHPGGEVWCSPTALSMVLAWWGGELDRPELDQPVPKVAEAVHDPGWPGTGNWPFNTAYAGSFPGMVACVGRLRDVRALEDLIAEGVPVIVSVKAPALRGESSAPEGGHLIVVVGFTATGDIVANDPWARLETGQRVRRVYARGNFVTAWAHADRLAYLIAPAERARVLPVEWVVK